MTEYLDFVQLHDTGKTKVWAVMSRTGGYRLAQIRWHGAWRQYTFWPEPDTIWNTDCLQTVQLFIAEQMNARRRKLSQGLSGEEPVSGVQTSFADVVEMEQFHR